MKFDVRLGDCMELFKSMPEDSVDFVMGSPPYALKGRRYGDSGPVWKVDDWIGWMLSVTTAAVRASRGHVAWVVNSAVRGGRYIPAVEGLIWQGYERGLIGERSVIWRKKNALPSRKDWFVNDYETIVVFKSAASGLHFDWQAIAQPKKYESGGRFRQRTSGGKRRMQCEDCDWKGSVDNSIKVCPDCGGKVVSAGNAYPKGKLARPRDVLVATVGGGHLGSALAHENEAPFPERIVEPLVRLCCPEGGTVLDPFSGSGTTGAVALKLGRQFIGFENRKSQIALTRRRLKEAIGEAV